MKFRQSINFLLIFLLISNLSFSQDSTLVGRFSVGVFGSYSKSNIVEEATKGGAGLQFRYFPSTNFAFSLTYQNLGTTIIRYEKLSKANNSSLGFGIEKHIPFNNFSPYIGLEAGLNITKVKSGLIQLPSNIVNFQNNLPTYLLKPKVGLRYSINNNIFANFEASFNWAISADREYTNPLFDDSYTAIYFGRKVPTVSIGLHYLFKE